MKNLLFISFVCFLPILSYSQWAGSTTTSGTIYRFGNVGIGLSNPSHNLHVKASFNPSFGVTNNQSAKLEIGVASCSNCFSTLAVSRDAVIRTGGTNSGKLVIVNGAQKDIVFGIGTSTSHSEIMRLLNGGKVKIGDVTTPGNYKLYVEDGILTEELTLALKSSGNWADYVFDENYQLMDMQSLEQYISKNKHLPGIPSGSEIYNQGGIALKDITVLQMEKIEELTLYLIEAHKRLIDLENEMADLKDHLLLESK